MEEIGPKSNHALYENMRNSQSPSIILLKTFKKENVGKFGILYSLSD